MRNSSIDRSGKVLMDARKLITVRASLLEWAQMRANGLFSLMPEFDDVLFCSRSGKSLHLVSKALLKYFRLVPLAKSYNLIVPYFVSNRQ